MRKFFCLVFFLLPLGCGPKITSKGVIKKKVASTVSNSAKPALYVLAVGTSNYVGNALDLNFAEKDAEQFARTMELIGSEKIFPKRHLRVLPCADSFSRATLG